LEAISEIAGSSLEQTTFFRRNLAVKPGPQVDVGSEMEDVTTDADATAADGQLSYNHLYSPVHGIVKIKS